jgi:hypothetical protein
VTVKNNIFYDTDPNTNENSAVLLWTNPIVEFDVNYNLYYKPTGNHRIISINGGATYTLSQINTTVRSVLGWEKNGTAGNPLFVDAANHNFRLQPGSPAIGKGVRIPEVTMDFDGKPFNSMAPSMGAFEYTG